MTDPDTTLDRIDAETAKCICGNPIPADGPSLDYCSLPCQYRWTAEHIGAAPAGVNLYPAAESAGGQALNERVAHALTTSHPQTTPDSASTVTFRDDEEPSQPRILATIPFHIDTRNPTAGIQAFTEALESVSVAGHRIAGQMADLVRGIAIHGQDGQPPTQVVARFSLDGVQHERTGTLIALGDGQFEFHSPAPEPAEDASPTGNALRQAVADATGIPPELTTSSTETSARHLVRDPYPEGPPHRITWNPAGSAELADGIDLTPYITAFEPTDRSTT